jgi:O-antigen/teichoic acid export membrane protein
VTVRQWSTRGILSVLDQAAISGANFALSIFYARWLSPEQYGVFSVLLAAFLFAAGFHNALLLEPMSVLGSARRAHNERGYVGTLVLLHVLVTGTLGLTLAVVGAIIRFNSVAVGSGLMAVGACLPVILLYWLLRRACYLSGDPSRAARCGFAYALAVVIILFVSRPVASPSAGLMVMAGASIVASVAAIRRTDFGCRPEQVALLFKDHWRYGRWVLGIALLYWATGSFFAPMLGFFSGLANAANFRAAENLLLPVSQVITALTLFLLPWMSAEFARSGTGIVRRITIRATVAASLIGGGYCVTLLVFGKQALRFLYGGESYGTAFALVPILCLTTVVRAASDLGVGLSLKAAARPDSVFWASAAAAISTLTIGVWLVRERGPVGAAWAALLAACVQAGGLGWRFAKIETSQRLQPTAACVPAGLGEQL